MDDRKQEEFYAAWRSMPARGLIPFIEIDWQALTGSEVGELTGAKLVEAPSKYAELVFISLQECPKCGVSARFQPDSTVVSIYPEFTRFPALGFGAVAHRTCVDACPIVEGPTPIPW